MTRGPLRSEETCKGTEEDSQATGSKQKQNSCSVFSHSLQVDVLCLLTRRRWCQCWTLHKLIQGCRCPWLRCPDWRQTCRTKSFLRTENIKWAWFWSDIKPGFPPSIPAPTSVKRTGFFPSAFGRNSSSSCPSGSSYLRVKWEWISDLRTVNAGGGGEQTSTDVPGCLGPGSGRESNSSPKQKYKAKTKNTKLFSYDHCWWERILNSVTLSEMRRDLVQPRSEQCVKLTDPPPTGSSPARPLPLQDHDSSRWRWGSSQSEWLPSLRPCGNSSGSEGPNICIAKKQKWFRLSQTSGNKGLTKSDWFYLGKANESRKCLKVNVYLRDILGEFVCSFA